MNVLVYYPKFNKKKRVDIHWLYGIDIIEKLSFRNPEWNFIYVDGSQNNIYKDIDIVLRPVRHDGYSRMIAEAEYFNIPYIWSYETGKYVRPDINDIERRLIVFSRTIKKR